MTGNKGIGSKENDGKLGETKEGGVGFVRGVEGKRIRRSIAKLNKYK